MSRKIFSILLLFRLAFGSSILRPTAEITPLTSGFVVNVTPLSDVTGTLGVYVVSLAKDRGIQTNSYKYPSRATKYNISGLQDGRWYAVCFELDVKSANGEILTDGWCSVESTLKSGGARAEIPVTEPEVGIYKGVINVKFNYEKVPLQINVKVDDQAQEYLTEGGRGPKVISYKDMSDLDKVKRICWSYSFVEFKPPFNKDYGIDALDVHEKCMELKIEEKYLSDRWYEQIPYGGLILAIVLSVPMAIAL